MRSLNRLARRNFLVAPTLATLLMLGLPPAGAADRNINLDGLSGNGAESNVATNVVTTYPAKIRNKVTNRAVGQAFRFSWAGAGPGGCYSSVGPGTTSGTGMIWTWETVQQVFAITGNIDFVNQGTGAQSTFGQIPGRSLTSSGVTTSSASLTSSLITFFSPLDELVRVTSSVEQLGFGFNRFAYDVTNLTGDPLNFEWSGGPIGCNAPFCGNEVREGGIDLGDGEACDGSDLGGTTCEDLGYSGGVLGCTSECEFDTSGCTGPSACGNGVIDEPEQCDGDNLGGTDCTDLGYQFGTLACTESCTFDTSGCTFIGLNGGAAAAAPQAPSGEIIIPCEFGGAEGKIDGNTKRRVLCRISPHPAKEVSSQIIVCGDSIPQGTPCGAGLGTQGTANAFVPDTGITIGGIFISPFSVEVQDGSDGRLQCGETANLFIELLNAGNQTLTDVSAQLSSIVADLDGDGSNDVPNVTQANSDYPDLPAAQDLVGDCDTILSGLDPKRNLTAFTVQLPASPCDVAYKFVLTVSGTPGSAVLGTDFPVNVIAGVGSGCDPTTITGDFDRLVGFLSPMGPLVPADNDSPLPPDIDQESPSLPLKLKLFCGSKQLTGKDGVEAPVIVRLTRDGVDVDLDKISLDVNSNSNDHSLSFRFSAGNSAWTFNLKTNELEPGLYEIYVQMPNGQVYKSTFLL